MKTVTTTSQLLHSTTESKSHLFDDWFDLIETGIRDRVRGLIEEMIRGELDAALSRPRYGRLAEHAEGSGVTEVVTGHRHGSRVRTLTGTFGKTEIAVPRGSRPRCGRNFARRNFRQPDYIVLSCEFNWLIDGFSGKGFPAVDLAHTGLAGCQQRPEQHGGRVCRRQHGLRFDPALELLV